MKKQKLYRNAFPHKQHGLLDVLRWQLGLGPKETPTPSSQHGMPCELQPVSSTYTSRTPSESVRLTWVGHSTFLIQLQGRNILTDPIFGNCQPALPLARLRRIVPPGLTFEALPPIRDVIISHCHYDHLDLPTVRRLDSIHSASFWLPSGLARWFQRRGINRCSELAWWNSAELPGNIRLHCVPAQHFSARGLFDRNHTHWCGWVLQSQNRTIYFAGDTGYCPVFRDIGERFGGFNLAMIPIGAYRPRWLMQPMHVDPEEAVKIHLDVHARQSVACHWGTFPLADEPLTEPPQLLAQALERRDIPAGQFRTLRFGETIEV